VHAVRMPPLGTTSDDLTIVSWLKAEGDEVAVGEPLLQVETDKATLEVEAAAAGTLVRIDRRPGETVRAGTPLGWIGAAGEAVPDAVASRKEASPAVRSLARELGVALEAVAGSGPSGRVEREDVLAAAGDGERIEPLSTHRAALARRLARATAIPQFSVGVTVDWGGVRADEAPTPLLLRAVAATLRDHPALNALWAESGRIRRLERCDVGLAVAGDDELYVVTIPEPDLLPPEQLADAVAQAADDARTGRGRRTPAAVILSNLGGTGVDRFTAILDPDATAVLAAGRAAERLELTLTVDHRVADGAAAARFLAALRDRLEGADGK
jgi:pyruvate dehydrogenase E2 component (dihydrolipoyllysine-residue acetyltransferase)